MAHFALLDENNKILTVIVVGNEYLLDKDGNESEAHGKSWCEKFWHRKTGDVGADWKQTSYNTSEGIYYNQVEQSDGTYKQVKSSDQSKSFRKNFACIRGTYDSTRDAFISPQLFKGWVINETTCQWGPPTDDPSTSGALYTWSNVSEDWVEMEVDGVTVAEIPKPLD